MVRVVPLQVGQTSIGTGATTDTAIGGGAYTIPNWCKSILACKISGVTDLPTAAESWVARGNFTSDNLPVQPFHPLAAPIGSILGASGGAQFAAKPEVYTMNLRSDGGEQITFNMRNLVASTSANYGNVVIVATDARPMEAQQHIQAGTLTQDTAINAENEGTSYSISGARNIVELLGFLAGTTQATSEGITGRIRFTSNEFDGLSSADLMLAPVASGLATLQISFIDGVSRQKCMIPVQNVSQVNIIDAMRIISSANIGANVSWVSAVAYEV